MKTCDEVLDLISLRLDGELTPEQASELAEHLASCPACKALADDLAGIRSVMPGMNVQPPAFIMENVMERIKGEVGGVLPFPAKKNSRPQWKAWTGVAAALVLVVGGAFVLWGGGNATKGGEPMMLDAGIPEVSVAPSAYRAAIDGAQGKESIISLPTPEPSAVPSCAPAEATADEPASQYHGGTGEDKTADNVEKSSTTTATAGTEPPQTRNFMMLPPQSEPSAAPSTTPTPTPMPTPDNGQQLTGLQIAPVTMPLTPAEAAQKLYEEKCAERFPDLTLSEREDFIGYVIPDWWLKYVGVAQDGTAYEFKEAYFEGETEAIVARYLVPLDGSEIQMLNDEPVK